jgi:Alginate lyase
MTLFDSKLASALIACSVSAGVLPAAEQHPRVFVLDPAALATAKSQAATGDERRRPALEQLRREADAALDVGPFSVVDGGVLPPSGDPHDYMSVGPYWWPDPKKDDGLPYIRRDGRVNPEYHEHDATPRGKMCSAVETLALAYYFTGHEPYAEHAAKLLRVWFLDEDTRMNPNLQFGQAIPGRCTGRGIGIIETLHFVSVVDAAGLLAGSNAWTKEDQQAIEAWFAEYLDWMLESRYGRDEAATKNNHGTWYDAQVASFALFVGQDDVARRILSEVAEKRIARQIEPDGRQPHELARTKSFSYSVMNLRGMFTLAALAEEVDVDLWDYQTDDGRSIRKAIDWLGRFTSGDAEWKHEQISGLHAEALYPLLRWATIAYDEPSYEKQIKQIPNFEPKAERTELLRPAR